MTLLATHTRTARKPHRCFHCCSPIAKGERYRDARWADDGRAYSLATHLECEELFGALWESWHDPWDAGRLAEVVREECLVPDGPGRAAGVGWWHQPTRINLTVGRQWLLQQLPDVDPVVIFRRCGLLQATSICRRRVWRWCRSWLLASLKPAAARPRLAVMVRALPGVWHEEEWGFKSARLCPARVA